MGSRENAPFVKSDQLRGKKYNPLKKIMNTMKKYEGKHFRLIFCGLDTYVKSIEELAAYSGL